MIIIKSKLKRLILIITSIIVSIPLVIIPAVTVVVYEIIFNRRFETPEWAEFDVSEFEGLTLEECEFSSYKGKTLKGYKYSSKGVNVIGVAVFSHGMGGGHNTYLPMIDYISKMGYLVFAYDATGCNESEGGGVRGLPQGIADLDLALDFVAEDDDYNKLPVVLIGHSWGAYSVGNVIGDHPEVKSAVMISGFSSSDDLIYQYGYDIFGFATDFMASYVYLYEDIKFGDYADFDAVSSLKNSNATIMIVYSDDDDIIEKENGYDVFYREFYDNSRFKFVNYTNRGHGKIYCSDSANEYKKELEEAYEKYIEFNKLPDTDKRFNAFMQTNIDKKRYFELDYQLMNDIIDMFDMACK